MQFLQTKSVSVCGQVDKEFVNGLLHFPFSNKGYALDSMSILNMCVLDNTFILLFVFSQRRNTEFIIAFNSQHENVVGLYPRYIKDDSRLLYEDIVPALSRNLTKFLL